MAFPPGFLDELRSRISLSGLVSRRVKLERRGREFAGLCPFHHEKTPSFYVVDDKDFFHCFGCGAHGDAIGFVMRAENLDFLEAVERLAAEAGVAVPQSTPEEQKKAQRQKTLLETLEAASAFYEARLWSPAGQSARDYLKARGLDTDTIRRFRLGWASDDRQALRRALEGDYSEPLLVEAGLLHCREDGEPFDYFRSRLIFPIGDRAGRTIAFGGRVLGDGQPKYLNSPESPVFEKGRVLYGWSVARAAAAAGQDVIVAEGYMDVIALHRAGFASAVAPLGTALTEFQLQELWRLGPEPILCFDGDTAGERAAARALRRALPLLRPGCSLRFAVLPAGDDPDSLLRREGREALQKVLRSALRMAPKLWEIEVGARPIDTAERRADLERRLIEDIELIPDRGIQTQYRAYLLGSLFREATWGPRNGRKRQIRQVGDPWFVESRGRAPRSPARRQRELLFYLLLSFPSLIEEVAEEFAALDIPEPELDKLRREILEIEALRPGLEASALRQHLHSNGFAATVDALFSPSVDSGFLIRREAAQVARSQWTHVMEMLMGGQRSVLAEASNHLIDEISPASWEHFLAAWERALRQDRGDGEPV
jgi:DNA primase